GETVTSFPTILFSSCSAASPEKKAFTPNRPERLASLAPSELLERAKWRSTPSSFAPSPGVGSRMPHRSRPWSDPTERPSWNSITLRRLSPESNIMSADSPSRFLVIVNPAAGQGDAKKTLTTIGDVLTQANLNFKIASTEGANDALELAKNATNFDRVLVAGGDGTVMEVLSGMVRNPSPVPIGI